MRIEIHTTTLPAVPVDTISTVSGLIWAYTRDPLSPYQVKSAVAQAATDEALVRLERDIGHLSIEMTPAEFRPQIAGIADELTHAALRAVLMFGAIWLNIDSCKRLALALRTWREPSPATRWSEHGSR